MIRIVALLGIVSWAICSFAGEKEAPIDIGSRRELFVDEALISSQQGTTLKPHLPEARDVVLTCDAPWEGNISGYYTFIVDDGLFRVYYRGAHFADKKVQHEVTCYAESKDGLNWVKPKLGLYEFNGSKENNIIWPGSDKRYITHNFTPLRDDNPDCPPDARYKALAGERHSDGLRALKSADGVRWSLMQDEPVITDGYFDSQNLAFWDTNRKCYVSYYRDFRGPKKLRDIKVATSPDFINWSTGTYLTYNDFLEEQLYTNAIRQYFRAPHLYVGFPTRYQAKTEQVEPILMTSRDGAHFNRWPEPLIPITAPKDRDGNRSNYMAHGLIQIPGQDREISVFGTEAYYEGPGSRVRRFTFRTDGFVSVNAEAAGDMLTKKLQFFGNTLQLNYAAQEGGSLQVEILDEQGKPLPGFALADCPPLTGNEISQTVTWKAGSDLSALAGKTVQLRFALKQADLYALQFVTAP